MLTLGTGYNQKNIDLLNTTSYNEIIEILKQSKQIPKGEWIIGRGWHQDKWTDSPEKLIKGFQLMINYQNQFLIILFI